MGAIRNAVHADPIILPVPGNHDLSRPGDARPITRCGLKSYTSDEAIRRGLLEGNSEVRTTIASIFKAYTEWFNKSVLPTWRDRGVLYELGKLPGDYRATLAVNELRVGVVGINSAYLHFDDQPSADRCLLAVEHEQVGEDFGRWRRLRDASLLLMHHPLDWLESRRRGEFMELRSPYRWASSSDGHGESGDSAGPKRGSGAGTIAARAPDLFEPSVPLELDASPADLTPHALTNHELVSRLSYFIWSSMPDEELFAAADAGTLHEPAALAAQVTRMLRDPKAEALLENFAGQWLGLRAH